MVEVHASGSGPECDPVRDGGANGVPDAGKGAAAGHTPAAAPANAPSAPGGPREWSPRDDGGLEELLHIAEEGEPEAVPNPSGAWPRDHTERDALLEVANDGAPPPPSYPPHPPGRGRSLLPRARGGKTRCSRSPTRSRVGRTCRPMARRGGRHV